MQRVLSFVTTGLFMTGLCLLPLSVRADPAATGAKDGKAHSGTTTMTAPVTQGVQGTTTPMKAPGDKTVTTDPASGSGKSVTPGGPGIGSGTPVTKTPSKGAS